MLLPPKLRATPNSRLRLQSSERHRVSTSEVEFRNLAEINQDPGANAIYARTKLEIILLAKALERRKHREELGLAPGEAPWRREDRPELADGQLVRHQEQIGHESREAVPKDPIDEGCRAIFFAATSDAVKEKIDEQHIVPDHKVKGPSKQSEDEEL